YYIVNENSDVLVRYADITNSGRKSIRLRKAFSFALDLPDNKFKLLRLAGNKTAECTPEITALGYGVVRLQSLRGASSHQLNPFAALCRKDTSETSGECFGVQLVYSGSWAITVEADNTGKVRVQGGINDTAFCWELDGGKTFTTPQVALCYSADGFGKMSVEYADFLRKCIINPKFVYARRPILVNNWEATYFDFDYKKLFAIIDEAAQLGIDTFVLDDGWFGRRNWDDSSLGDWFVNTEKLPQGLTPIINRCKERGLKFGLWFEPEMISENSDLFRAHPDWAIGKTENPYYRERNQLVLDFTRREVVDYVFEAVGKILSENEISYVKWDMNRSMSEFFSSALSSKNQGELAHRYILGVYDLAERLTETFGNIFFEGCSSGGGRFDAGMLYYFAQIWTS
ncbi:MAG: alpha-galactosidase, partial [Clostridia bacterium]|nr:alpha-galactosidase [Clostridia bacterium]